MSEEQHAQQLSQFSKASRRLAQNLLYSGFDPAEYVKSVSAKSDGDRDLEDAKLKISALADETSQILKKQVYDNYQQFIYTAKEISSLEQEMKTINNILTKQRSVMDKMASLLVEDSGIDLEAKLKEQEIIKNQEQKEEQDRQALSIIIENVENCDPNLIKANRFLITDGRVAELNAETFQPFQEVHMYLMNDVLLLATHESIYADNANSGLPNRKNRKSMHQDHMQNQSNLTRFKFEIMYPLKDIAVVNARDIGPMRNSFKILMFPEHRVFQCSDNKEKRNWLDLLDSTKRKFMQSLENPTANLPKLSNENELEGGDNNLQNLKNRAGSMMTTIKSPTGDGNSPNLDDIESVYGEDQYEKLDTAWLQEAIEEFDVFVAQRQFKEAADLINTGIEYLTGIRSKVEEGQFKEWAIQYSKRRNELVWVLRKDLMVQTTTRMQRTPCALLVKGGMKFLNKIFDRYNFTTKIR